MSFIFYIDSQRVDNPMNDMSLVTKISRDDQIGGIVITQDASLQWNKNNAPATGEVSAYNLLKTAFDEALCSEVDLEIYSYDALNTTYLKHKGVIKIPQLEFSEQEIIITTKVQDNSFYSLIFNNRDLKVDFRAMFTKNALDLTPLPFYTVDMFNGCTGGFTGAIGGAYYKGYLITDIFAFIISAITDNQVGFQSDWLSDRTYPLMLFKGQSLLNSFTIFPGAQEPVFEISFNELYNEINAIENLYWYIDNSDVENPVFRLEAYEETFTTSTGVTIENPLLIKTAVDVNTLWGLIKTGSETTVDGTRCADGGWYSMNEAISLHGFKREDFFPKGQCNRNIEYNTVNSWVISNNVIQDILIGLSTQYIDDYVLVEVDGVDDVFFTANGYPHTFFGQPTPPFFYNLGINNMYKMSRHASKFQTTFGNFLGIGTLGFKALLGDDNVQDITYVTGPASHPNFIPPGGSLFISEFPNESTNGGYDGSGNYDNVLFRYTVPQDGNYSFHQQLHFETTGLVSPGFWVVNVGIVLYDSGLVIKASNQFQQVFQTNSFHYIDVTFVADCVATDIVQASYTLIYNPNGSVPQTIQTLTVIWDSYFEANGTPEGGVSVAAGNPSVRNLLHDMEYSFSETEWRQVVAAPTGMIPFTKDGVTRYGWIKDISRSDQTGLAQIKLLSSNATS